MGLQQYTRRRGSFPTLLEHRSTATQECNVTTRLNGVGWQGLATIHPSSVLRARDDDSRRLAYEMLVADLAVTGTAPAATAVGAIVAVTATAAASARSQT